MSTRIVAAQYIADGFPVVPIPPNTKKATVAKWEKTTFTPSDFNEDGNIAIRLDNHIVVDSEDANTTALARELIPGYEQAMNHGRNSYPDAHPWYHAHPDVKYRKFEDTIADPVTGHKSIIEILTDNGHYVLAPPSTHPSGELVEWVEPRRPIFTLPDGKFFVERVTLTAIGGLVFRHWSEFGHESMANLAGMLLQRGISSSQVTALFTAMAKVGPGKSYANDFVPFVERTIERHEAGEFNGGAPKLETSVSKDLIDRILSFLPKSGQKEKRPIRFVTADQIKPAHVKWLHTDWIPLGFMGLLGGREGLGKSLECAWEAAEITRGRLPGAYFGIPKSVIIVATEDSWAHIIVPRLMAAGADLSKVIHAQVGPLDGFDELNLPADIDSLAEAIEHRGDVVMMYLDPLISRLSGKLDTHKDAEVRRALEPLGKLAARFQFSIKGLIHVNKSGKTDPLDLIMGSKAFTAFVRFVHFVVEDPSDDSIRLYGMPKNNYGPRNHETKTFITLSDSVDHEGETYPTARLEWRGIDPRSISQILREGIDMVKQSKTGDALRWLLDYLNKNGGAAESNQIKQDGKTAGYSLSTLKRAAGTLNVQMHSMGFPRKTFWALPGVAINLGHMAAGLP